MRARLCLLIGLACVAGSLTSSSPAGASAVALADLVRDVGDRRADVAALSVDQDGPALVVGVRLVEYTDPRTDPHWTDPQAASTLHVAVDANADGRIDYDIDLLRVARGPTGLAVQVSSFPGSAPRCTGGFSLDPPGGWIRVSAPKSCMPATSGYRVQVMYAFHRSVDGPMLSALADFVPDGGRFHPLTSQPGAASGSAQAYPSTRPAAPPTTPLPRLTPTTRKR
jgi:hypothetical protein